MGATSLELKVLSSIRTYQNFLKYHEILRSEFFKSLETKTVYKTIVQLHRKFKRKRLTLNQIWMVLEPKLDTDEHGMYRRLLLRVKQQTDDDEDIIEDTIIRFARESQLSNELVNAVNQIAAGQELDLDNFKTNIDKILSVNGYKRKPDYNYFGSIADRLNPKHDLPRLPTGFSRELDAHLDGGLAAGEFAFFLAPTGRGKTLALVNVGANALRMGKRVLHVTLEIGERNVAKRYDSCLSEMTRHEIKESPEIFKKRIGKILKQGGDLIISDYTYKHLGISQLHGMMEEYRTQKKPIDLVVLDYADLLISQDKLKESRFELNRLYQELRIFAGRFEVPVWTASQSNRAALNKRVVSMADVAEAYGKTNHADLILALCQTDEEKEDKEMRIFVAKTRMGETNPIVSLHCDLSRMILKAGKELDKEDVWSTPRISELRKRNTTGVRD